MKKSLLGLLVFFFAIAGSYPGLDRAVQEAQQQQTQLRHEVKVMLKLIQVYVTDNKGKPVLDLTKDDFLLLFFDFAFNNAIGIEKSRKAALRFIETQLRSTDEVGLISYSAMKSLKLHEYLTTALGSKFMRKKGISIPSRSRNTASWKGCSISSTWR
jgi:hypothetical protein